MSETGLKFVKTDDGVVASEVELGRDAKKRAFRREFLRPWRRNLQCLCCGGYTLRCVDCCEICPHCGWEDWYECHDAPEEAIRPNRLSLGDARRLVERFGPVVASDANQDGGPSIEDIERMSPGERGELNTLRKRFKRGLFRVLKR